MSLATVRDVVAYMYDEELDHDIDEEMRQLVSLALPHPNPPSDDMLQIVVNRFRNHVFTCRGKLRPEFQGLQYLDTLQEVFNEVLQRLVVYVLAPDLINEGLSWRELGLKDLSHQGFNVVNGLPVEWGTITYSAFVSHMLQESFLSLSLVRDLSTRWSSLDPDSPDTYASLGLRGDLVEIMIAVLRSTDFFIFNDMYSDLRKRDLLSKMSATCGAIDLLRCRLYGRTPKVYYGNMYSFYPCILSEEERPYFWQTCNFGLLITRIKRHTRS